MSAKTRHVLLSRLSIQQRLPLLMFILLLSVVILYGFANYFSLKKASLAIGRERLRTISGQISAMLGQSAGALVKAGNTAAAQSSVIQCLKSGGKDHRNETLDALDKLHRDSTWISAELTDTRLTPLLYSRKTNTRVNVNLNNVIASTHPGPDSTRIGKIYKVDGLMYYPVVTAVAEKQKVIGYIIAWVRLYASQKAVDQLSQLVGTGAGFYVVNTDGSLWTDFMKPVPPRTTHLKNTSRPFEYINPEGKRMLADARNVVYTDWLIMAEFSEENVLSGASAFVKWITAIGLVITAIGIFAAWLMSRTITKPLNQLIAAARLISEGNYSSPVPVDVHQNDELGQLANAFNIMLGQVSLTHHELESKVEKRTSQLENVNKELEAFSYSVSHDLRTPLRAINGYSIMLKEDYESELDSEGRRILRNIIINAKMMGQLIDDLLAFSRLGKKELVRKQVDMYVLATTVINELLQHEPENKYHVRIGDLPGAEADEFMIKQVLVNLVSNAIKYSSKKEAPSIEIGAMDETNRTVYYVKDNGAGFDMAYADKLFGVFQRLHSQEEFEGTGVGLALAKRIIDKHLGAIWAEGREAEGAVFYFSLPKS